MPLVLPDLRHDVPFSLVMTTKVPQENQYLVFWIDPSLTLQTYGDDEDSELMKAVGKLTFQRYVGCVGMVCFHLSIVKSIPQV